MNIYDRDLAEGMNRLREARDYFSRLPLTSPAPGFPRRTREDALAETATAILLRYGLVVRGVSVDWHPDAEVALRESQQ